MNVRFDHYQCSEEGHAADAVLVPHSKLDQAGTGKCDPMMRHIPHIGDIRSVIIAVKRDYWVLGLVT